MWEQQTLLSEVAPVKASLSQARGKDSQELPDSCSNTFERYVNSVHVGLSGENVPGAFTSERGEAYRQLLSEMDALGYGLAWRVLDAQFFGVAQRRERVFLVGSLGTMRCAEVLFERESLSWDHQSSRQKRERRSSKKQYSDRPRSCSGFPFVRRNHQKQEESWPSLDSARKIKWTTPS